MRRIDTLKPPMCSSRTLSYMFQEEWKLGAEGQPRDIYSWLQQATCTAL